MDSGGDLVAAGYSEDEESGELNFLVVKLSGLDGSILWNFAANTSSTGDVFQSVDIDERDNVFVAGGEGAPDTQGKVAEAPVVMKLDGTSGEEVWAYRGEGGSSIIFNSVAVDPTTGWVVGAGGTRGEWVEGASQGGFDFAAVVLDGDTGAELARWQNGTIGTDILEFAQFDASGGLYFGGYSSAAWIGGSGDEDVIAIKFEPLATSSGMTEAPSSAPTSSPTPGPTFAPSPLPTPGPSPAISLETLAPSAATRDIPLVPSPAPTASAASASLAGDGGSSEALEQWAVGAIAAGGGVFLILLALCELLTKVLSWHTNPDRPISPPFAKGNDRYCGATRSPYPFLCPSCHRV